MSASSSFKVRHLVRTLEKKYGKIPWWPGDCEEVMIGAILTQQTRWENVRKALDELQRKDLCTLSAIRHADPRTLEDAIRCTGFYRMKARKLKGLSVFVEVTCGGVERMAAMPTPALREALLSVHGIGEETADSILCYGFSRPSFVIDAYTDRIMRCVGVTEPRNRLKVLFEGMLPKTDEACRQTHAHIVEYAKEFCIKKRCDSCILVNSSG
jgi:endonuclease III related protein